jgi:ABC-type uncharacterized transport system auxiliary subunit
MMKQYLYLISLVVALFWLAGCGASVPPTHYYTFHPDPSLPPLQTETGHDPAVLGLETFEADVPYQQDKIVFRTSPYEVNFYEYHKWLHLPEDLVTEQVLKALSAARLFQAAYLDAFDFPVDYVLRGQIKMFDQWYESDTSWVRVILHYTLFTPEDNTILWTATVETRSDIADVSIVETVKGFEDALHDNVRQALIAIDQVLSQEHTN